MVTTFLFDIGNVVWFYKSSLERVISRWAQIKGVSYEEFRAEYKTYYKQFEVNQKILEDIYFPALDEIYTEKNFQQNLNLPVLNFISDLRKIAKVGFLSNAENFFYPYIQQKFLPYFDFGYCSWQFGLEKPNPEIYQKTLELQNLNPQDVTFIDDTQANIDTAQSLGIKSILFVDNQQFLSELRKITLPDLMDSTK